MGHGLQSMLCNQSVHPEIWSAIQAKTISSSKTSWRTSFAHLQSSTQQDGQVGLNATRFIHFFHELNHFHTFKTSDHQPVWLGASFIYQPNYHWLVVGPPLWKIWKSIGMMTIPNISGKIKNSWQPNHQIHIPAKLPPFFGWQWTRQNNLHGAPGRIHVMISRDPRAIFWAIGFKRFPIFDGGFNFSPMDKSWEFIK